MSQPRFFETRRERYLKDLADDKRLVRDDKTDNYTFTVGDVTYPVVNENREFPDGAFVLLGFKTAREFLIVNPQDPQIKKISAKILERTQSKKAEEVGAILREVCQLTQETFKQGNLAEVEKISVEWKDPENKIINDKETGVVPLDYFIEKEAGVCRHHAPLVGIQINVLIKAGKLPHGKVFLAVDSLVSVAHSWIVYHPTNSNDAYLVDSRSNVPVLLLRAQRDCLAKVEMSYGVDVLDRCLFQYLGNRSYFPDTQFRVTENAYELNGAELKVVRTLEKTDFSQTRLLEGGNQSYVLKEMNVDFASPLLGTDEGIKDEMRKRFLRFFNDAYFSAIKNGFSASYCLQFPVTTVVEGAQRKLTSYPKIHVLTKTPKGVPLSEFKINSSQQYLKMAVAILNSIHYLHCNKIAHMNICKKNIYVAETNEKFEVELRDFSQTDYFGLQFLCITAIIVSPQGERSSLKEYKDLSTASPVQDIYDLGRLLEELLPYEMPKVKKLLREMCHEDPKKRPPIAEVITQFKQLEKYYLEYQKACAVFETSNYPLTMTFKNAELLKALRNGNMCLHDYKLYYGLEQSYVFDMQSNQTFKVNLPAKLFGKNWNKVYFTADGDVVAHSHLYGQYQIDFYVKKDEATFEKKNLRLARYIAKASIF